jgi:hypothetical protein
MARVNQVIDDLDGSVSDDVETRYFGLDGKYYEIDLSKDNYDALVQELEAYVKVARPYRPGSNKGRGRGRPAPRRSRSAEENQKMREWARENGWPQITDRGRIPADVVQAYSTYQEQMDTDLTESD